MCYFDHMKVELPWPDKSLSPNARVHYMALARVKKAYSAECFWLTRSTIRQDPGSRRHLRITFCPPDQRPRDLDNMLASIKYGLDGFSQAVGIDDSEWSISIARGQPGKPGKVIVELTHEPVRTWPPGAEITEAGTRHESCTCPHCGGKIFALRDLQPTWTK